VIYRFGSFVLDRGTFKLLRDGEPLPIEPKALDLLALLVDRAPNVVDKAEIFSVVWKDVAVTDNALTRLVAQLRKTLNDDSKAPRYIETAATRGYRFMAAVDVDPVSRTSAATATVVDAQTDAMPAAAQRSSRVSLASAATVIALVALAWIAWGRLASAPSQAAPTEVAAPDIAKLAAVRPVEMTTGTGFDGFLAFSPDGGSFAFASDRSGSLEIYVQGSAPGSTPTALTANGRQNIQPAWSPDGQFIVYHEMAGNGIWVIPSRGGAARKLSSFGSYPAWSPDGRTIAFQAMPVNDIYQLRMPGSPSTIWTVDPSGSSPPVALTRAGAPAGPHLAPSWWRDSRRVLFAATSSPATGGITSIWSVELDTGATRPVARDDAITPDYVVTPDGRGLLFAARLATTIWWIPLSADGIADAPAQPLGLSTAGSRIAHLNLSTHRRLSWTTLDSSNNVWATAPRGAADPVPLTQGNGVFVGFPAVSPRGRIAVSSSRFGEGGNIFLLTSPGSMRQLTTDGSASHFGPWWMPDERELAIVSNHGGESGFWAVDADTGRERLLFKLSELPRASETSQESTATPAANVAFAPKFDRLAMSVVTSGVPNLWVAPMRDGRPSGPLVQRTFERDGGSYPVWSPDGRWIAYQCYSGTDTHVCVVGADSGERVQLTDEPGQSWTGGWATDNDTILFAARRAGIWNVASVSKSTKLVRMVTDNSEPRVYVRYPRWDATGSRVIFERAVTNGRVWSAMLPD
jgi:Tol biopolymer transport system component/DNA-binding winged helix-turn-helix (wHTH) protein